MAIIQAIGVGCRRCASSFLHDCLNNHPDIRKPRRGLHFFSENYHKGVSWYEHEVEKSSSEGLIELEYSVSYMYPEYYAPVANRMYEYNPEAKIFASIRNPAERAFSDYLRSQRNLEIPSGLTFEEALNAHPELIERGRYKRLLEPFIELYGVERLRLLIYEDLRYGLENYLSPLYQHLGVQTFIADINRAKPAEAGRAISNPRLQAALMIVKRSTDKAAYKMGMAEGWEASKNVLRSPYKRLRAANTHEVSMCKAARRRLLDIYEEDIAWVRMITGRKLPSWGE